MHWAKTFAALVFLTGLFAALSPAFAGTGDPVRFDAQRRAALAALPLLSGPPPAGTELLDRIVVLAFFASWCPPCHPEFEYLKEVDRRYGHEGVSVVAVNIFEGHFGGADRGRLAGFLANMAAGFTVLGDGEAVASLFGEVARIPTVFVFGRDGWPTLHFIHAKGAVKTHVTLEELEAAVRAGL